MKIVFPHPPGSGGPGSFQIRFEEELKKRGWTIHYAEDNQGVDIVFVVGGTKKVFWLLKMKLKRAPILYRLDGISWLHKKKKVGLKNYFISEFRTILSKTIHAFLTDKVIYQSKFVEEWWNKSGWRKRKSASIIYNGASLPKNSVQQSKSKWKKRLVILEGTIDYSPYAIKLINELAVFLTDDIVIELYGKFELPENEKKLHARIQYNGFLDREDVFNILSGSVYLSLDINPACPNTVIEAMACGAPVVAFDTGSVSELVIKGAGEIVPYGSDPWKLGYPDSAKLMKGIERVFNDYESYSCRAYQLAQENFGLEKMVAAYIKEIQSLIK